MKQLKLVHLLLAFLLGVVARMFMEKCSSTVEGMHCQCHENTTQSTCDGSDESCKWDNGECVADI